MPGHPGHQEDAPSASARRFPSRRVPSRSRAGSDRGSGTGPRPHAPATEVVALHRLHDGLGHAAAEERVLAVRLLVSAQAGVADRLDDQRAQLVNAHRPRLSAPRRRRSHEPGPGSTCCPAPALPGRWSRASTSCRGSLPPFAAAECPAASASSPLLKLVEELRLLSRPFEKDRVGQRKEAAGRSDARLALAQRELLAPLGLAGHVRPSRPS